MFATRNLLSHHDNLVRCADMDASSQRHNPQELRILTYFSEISLKAFLVHNENNSHAIRFAFETRVKDSYEKLSMTAVNSVGYLRCFYFYWVLYVC